MGTSSLSSLPPGVLPARSPPPAACVALAPFTRGQNGAGLGRGPGVLARDRQALVSCGLVFGEAACILGHIRYATCPDTTSTCKT